MIVFMIDFSKKMKQQIKIINLFIWPVLFCFVFLIISFFAFFLLKNSFQVQATDYNWGADPQGNFSIWINNTPTPIFQMDQNGLLSIGQIPASRVTSGVFGQEVTPEGVYNFNSNLYVIGNIGIGTTNPQAALDVAVGGIRLGGVTRTSWPAENQWSDCTGGICYNSGNVGIGTSGPSAKLKIASDDSKDEVHIGDSIWSGNDSTTRLHLGNSDGNSNLRLGQSDTAYGNIEWVYNATQNNTYLQIQSSPPSNRGLSLQPSGGNVGIGTAGPNSLLTLHAASGDVAQNFTLAGANKFIMGVDDSDNDNFKIEAGATLGGGTPILNAVSGGAVTLAGALTATGGNVGIGTTGPVSRLNLVGSGAASGIDFGGDTNIYSSGTDLVIDDDLTVEKIFYVEGDGEAELKDTFTPYTPSVFFENDITTLGTLSVNSSSSILNMRAGTNCAVRIDADNTDPNAAPNLFISTTGNVGIGTTGPTSKFDVVGYGKIGGDVIIGYQKDIIFDHGGSGWTGMREEIGSTSQLIFAPASREYSAIIIGANQSVDTIIPQGNLGIGTADPAKRLNIIQSGQNSIRLQKTAGEAGSVEIFPAVGDATSRTGSQLCALVSAQSVCLAYFQSGGTASTCATALTYGRALCADFGD